jgi:hypothetical protein
MVHAFQALLKQGGEFVIDIAGGDETLFFAAGAAIASLPEEKREHVRLLQLDPLAGVSIPSGGREAIAGKPVELKVPLMHPIF